MRTVGFASLAAACASLVLCTAAASAAPLSFGPPQQYAYGGSDIAVGDFNRDGVPDLAVANHDLGVLVRTGQPHGRFSPAYIYKIPRFPDETQRDHAGEIEVGDVNGDGDLDL